MNSLYQAFKDRAEAAKAEVFRLQSIREAAAFLGDLLARLGVAEAPGARALVAGDGWADARARQLLASTPGVSFDVTVAEAAQALAGVSRLEWALADTGTLAQDATPAAQRLVSTLPRIHVALVPTAGLLPDLPALLARVDPRRARYLALITGPSRTADIERVLTIGAHGPERLIIVFFDE
jgi:L-lactate dehydrogenase complex protein LldG